MNLREHLSITGTALRQWLVAQLWDCLAVSILWLVGLLLLHVPLAPLWAVLAGLFQFVPGLGLMLSVVGPAVAAALSGGVARMAYVLLLYAIIAVADGFVLQPLLMRRSALIPMWASILTPLVLGSVLSFWGVLLSVPVLAVIFAYREHYRRNE